MCHPGAGVRSREAPGGALMCVCVVGMDASLYVGGAGALVILDA